MVSITVKFYTILLWESYRTKQGTHLPLEGGVVGGCAQGGVPTLGKAKCELISMGIRAGFGFGTYIGFLSLNFLQLIQMYHPMRGDTNASSCPDMSGKKRTNTSRFASKYDVTLRQSFYKWTG